MALIVRQHAQIHVVANVSSPHTVVVLIVEAHVGELVVALVSFFVRVTAQVHVSLLVLVVQAVVLVSVVAVVLVHVNKNVQQHVLQIVVAVADRHVITNVRVIVQ